MSSKNKGYTLLELSIVLVVIGLITGAIMGGRALIRGSEMRSISTDVSKYNAAIITFKDKYFGLPGDITNATTIWGAAHATPLNCATTQGTGTQTCNGDGDGIIASTTSVGDPVDNEHFRAWQHLFNAELIEGKYTGVASSGGTIDTTPGVNVPASKMSGGGFSLVFTGLVAASANEYDGDYGHTLIFGRDNGTIGTQGTILSTEEAWSLDKKIDDGRPAHGVVRSFKTGGAYAPTCASSTDPAAAKYNFSDEDISCSLVFITKL